MLPACWPSFRQPAFALEPLGFLSLNHQIAAKFFGLESFGQNILAHP